MIFCKAWVLSFVRVETAMLVVQLHKSDVGHVLLLLGGEAGNQHEPLESIKGVGVLDAVSLVEHAGAGGEAIVSPRFGAHPIKSNLQDYTAIFYRIILEIRF